MRDRSNLKPEPISKKPLARAPVDMKLPRSDDGRVHRASGAMDNSSAAHYANAMDNFCGDPTGEQRKIAPGN